MKCPWCGATVMIRGSSWECGFCGDCGNLSSSSSVEISLSFTFVDHVDLHHAWNTCTDALRKLMTTSYCALLPLLGKTFVYQITLGAHHRVQLLPNQKSRELRTFLKKTSDLLLDCSTSAIIQKVKACEILYAAEGALSHQICGQFWEKLIQILPQQDFQQNTSNELDDLIEALSEVYAYYCDDEMTSQAAYREELQDAFYARLS